MDRIMQFFDLVRPCPEEFPNCEQLRREYVNEYEEMKRRGGCGQCMERNLKNNWIIKLQNLIKT
ncbi:hypothetical protein EBR43_02310 [bacterium]|nr:hypothetical protein [bacterium]